MTYQESDQENKMKTILSEFKPTNSYIAKYDRSDKEDNNMFFMTIADLRMYGVVDNFPKKDLTD